MAKLSPEQMLKATVIVSALGYMVDVYDLVVFSVVRISSLKSLGLSGENLISSGVFLLNMQMIGMLLGGILWGIYGDKKGRTSVLFGSIFLYSSANIANAFVHSVNAYAFWRFLAGLGLAGELGAGVTLVCEKMSQQKRGFGTTVVATVGLMGGVMAAFIGDRFDWRTVFITGGVLGFLLLALRVFVHESGLFNHMKELDVPRGHIGILFRNRKTAIRYLNCILTGIPIWFIMGIMATFAPELGRALGLAVAPTAGAAVMFVQAGGVIGDLASGLLSQCIQSRIKVITLFLCLMLVAGICFWTAWGASLFYIYCIYAALGFALGYWVVLVTMSAEQFGTNIRATVVTTVPNFVRGATVVTTWILSLLKPQFGILHSSLYIGIAVMGLAFLALFNLEETFGKNLDFIEGEN